MYPLIYILFHTQNEYLSQLSSSKTLLASDLTTEQFKPTVMHVLYSLKDSYFVINKLAYL